MKQDGGALFEQLFGDKSFKAPTPAPAPEPAPEVVPGDYCVKCQKLVVKLPVMVPGSLSPDERNLFYCGNHSCEHFGVLTVVIKRIR